MSKKSTLLIGSHLPPSTTGLQFACSDAGLPTDERNLVVKAALSFFAYTQIQPDVHIYLDKHIPVAAGLGGGSSDAGTCLRGLNSFFNMALTDSQLFELASPLGADVPFFVSETPAFYATGIGNKLCPIEPVDPCWIVLVNPGISISTKWAYDNFTLTREGNSYNLLGCSKSLFNASRQDDAPVKKAEMACLCNDLEEVTLKKYTVIQDIKDELIANGAVTSLMSGSGATVFGVFDHIETAHKCKEKFSKRYSAVFLAEPIIDTF
nr:4-(cytidine 5'-diphospho)-2-C-methyl-D-erythritol kinase [Desulfobulbaceae bacterium]